MDSFYLTGINYRKISGWDRYFITDDGRLLSRSSRYGGRAVLPDGMVRVVKGYYLPKGYHSTTLVFGKRRRNVLMHRLVLEAFVGPCPDGMECRHIDGNPANNRLDNLAWGTPQENAADKEIRKTAIHGGRHKLAKLSDLKVFAARDLHSLGWTHSEIAALFQVHRSAISSALSGDTWGHIQKLLPKVG